MKYAQHRSQIHGKRARRLPFWPFPIILGLVLIVIIVFFIRGRGAEDPAQSDNVLLSNQEDEKQAQEVQIVDDEVFFEEIALQGGGIARRGATDELFTHVVVADLPVIDLDGFFYEGWLVNPKTLDFFSTGEMFARQDGKWGLVYETNDFDLEELKAYSQVVLTLEPRDGDPAPAPDHILEADF